MAEHPSDAGIAAHIESVSARPEADTARLVAELLRRCWPGGPSDRTEPEALEWVRRSGPRVGAVPQACSCAEGRCELCN
jgi:hypothetical protein